jgi:hypothetical protein
MSATVTVTLTLLALAALGDAIEWNQFKISNVGKVAKASVSNKIMLCPT